MKQMFAICTYLVFSWSKHRIKFPYVNNCGFTQRLKVANDVSQKHVSFAYLKDIKGQMHN